MSLVFSSEYFSVECSDTVDFLKQKFADLLDVSDVLDIKGRGFVHNWSFVKDVFSVRYFDENGDVSFFTFDFNELIDSIEINGCEWVFTFNDSGVKEKISMYSLSPVNVNFNMSTISEMFNK